MNTEDRLRDLMAAYHSAASSSDGDAPLPRTVSAPRSRWVAATALAAVAALLVLVVVQRRGSSPVEVGSGAATPVVVHTPSAYAAAIRSSYQRLFDDGEDWWFVPPNAQCHIAAWNWDDVSRQNCQASDAEAADAARSFGLVLTQLRPPSRLASVHAGLSDAARALNGVFSAQVDDLISRDEQAFREEARPIGDALGSLCESIQALNANLRDNKLPVDNNWCTG